jgi:hypothetical protein
MSVISAFGRPRQEDHEFEGYIVSPQASMGYIARPCHISNNNKSIDSFRNHWSMKFLPQFTIKPCQMQLCKTPLIWGLE